MKSYTIFVCERCGYENATPEYIELCEARHIGLDSLEDYRQWKLLNDYAKHCTARLSSTNNEQLRKLEEEAYAELLKFEKEYDMKV